MARPIPETLPPGEGMLLSIVEASHAFEVCRAVSSSGHRRSGQRPPLHDVALRMVADDGE